MDSWTLEIDGLRMRYLSGELTPHNMIAMLLARLLPDDPDHVWIYRLSADELYAYATRLEGLNPRNLPLYGIPFAIKDNIDLGGVPTTAACPEFSYIPEYNAAVVQRLIEAGAIPIGKTNMDQFATGLNGTRSPYGVCRNAYNPNYISGGSSSGSAVAVAKGWVSFSLGTDTAGSGRVPAALNNIIGLKPSLGWISTLGVVPACRSLDTVSIFALTANDAETVLAIAAAYDPDDSYSRRMQGHGFDFGTADCFRFGIPAAKQLEFFGNTEGSRLYAAAIARLQALGGEAIEIDFSPFLAAARLLYEGPWVAERYVAIKDFFDAQAQHVMSPVREIIEAAKRYSAADAFTAQYRLQQLKIEVAQTWKGIDCLLTPTVGTTYTIAQLQADPVSLNANLGYYTNFMNLLDCASVAVPAGFQNDGLPFGITLVAPAHQDAPLLHLAQRFNTPDPASGENPLAALSTAEVTTSRFPSNQIRLAVAGAHMTGLPLNHQLTQRGGRLVKCTRSSPDYRFYALPGGPPHRPGMVRVKEGESGVAIEVEVWELAASEFGTFVAAIPAPLGIATVTLANGDAVLGFVCESYAVADALDITEWRGWRNYLQSMRDSG